MFPHADREFLDRTLGSRTGGRLFVSEDGGAPCGYAAVAEAPEATCAFVEVVVERFHRNRGLGRALLEAALATARLQGLARVEVHADPDNGLAADFLKSQGFRPAAAEAPGGGTVYRLELAA